jgi:cellulose synthase/poly-beta-1,6-N-acetylglucosamine synthase-like glycosyltransferase
MADRARNFGCPLKLHVDEYSKARPTYSQANSIVAMSKRRAGKTPTKTVSEATITHSVIVPAYKEKLNLRPLTSRLFAAFDDEKSPIRAENVELIIVDDNSRDGSVEEVDALRGEGYNVRIIVRTNERGLSSAVVRGFEEAKGGAMICMDADLQVLYF